MNLNKLNCMNYYVYDHLTGDHWYAQCGLRSLFEYSKITDKSFRYICEKLLTREEVTIIDRRPLTDDITERGRITLTMI